MSRAQQPGFILNWPILVIFLIFLAKTTSSVVLHLDLVLRATPAGNQDTAVEDFLKSTQALRFSQYITIAIETVICSGFFIYRCWLAYGRTWRVVVAPAVLWLAAVTAMGLLSHEGILGSRRSYIFGSCFWAFIIAVNIIITVLIARRVWRIDHLTDHSHNTQTERDDATSPTATKPTVPISSQPHDTSNQATRIIIESGMIYTTMTIAIFCLFVTAHVHVYAMIDILVQTIGIAFNLVIIRNRPRTDLLSYEARMNSVPLQFVSSHSLSVPGSTIEFAFPKHFNPRRKNRPVNASVGDISSPSIVEVPQTQSQQSV